MGGFGRNEKGKNDLDERDDKNDNGGASIIGSGDDRTEKERNNDANGRGEDFLANGKFGAVRVIDFIGDEKIERHPVRA